MTKMSFAFCVLSACVTAALSSPAARAQSVDKVNFDLYPNPAFKQCLGPNPQAHVQVIRGALNDKLTISISGVKPGLQFDLFTVQRSNLNPHGDVDPTFKGSFGLAWYQTDLQADDEGSGRATIQTILLDQIFGFDADTVPDTTPPVTRVPPTNTFHVGFWFNNPEDAASCGFNPSKPTPFNGEHKAGPLAMISIPVPPVNLGPLCTSPTGVTEDENAQDPTKLLCNP
jgi:hypothetical protein